MLARGGDGGERERGKVSREAKGPAPVDGPARTRSACVAPVTPLNEYYIINRKGKAGKARLSPNTADSKALHRSYTK